MAFFKVLGHRGAIDTALPFAQNSRQAFEEALLTADGFETDAIATADGEVFLAHEAKYVHHDVGVEYALAEHLDAASAAALGPRRLDELTAHEARQLRLKDGSPLPTLRETLALVRQHPGKVMNIELKGHQVLGPVLRILAESGIGAEQVLLSSFNHPSLLELRQQAPQYAVGALFVSTTTPSTPLFPWYAGSAGAYTTFTAQHLASPLVQEIKPDYIIIPDTELSAEAAALVQQHAPQAGLIAWVFTEAGGIGPEKLFALTHALGTRGQLAGLIIDKPRAYTEKLRQLAGTRP